MHRNSRRGRYIFDQQRTAPGCARDRRVDDAEWLRHRCHVRFLSWNQHERRQPESWTGRFGFDIGGKITFGDFEFLAWYYQSEGIGTAALFLLGDDLAGNERDSDGFLAQITYKLGDTKIGLNYGESNLDLAGGEALSDLVKSNQKYTLGAYHSLTENLTLLAEFSDVNAEAHSGIENDSSNFNIGAYLSF